MNTWRTLALVLGVATVTVATIEPVTAATWLPGVTVSDETSDVTNVNTQKVVVDAWGNATAVWIALRPVGDPPDSTAFVQTATRAAGAADFGPVQQLGGGGNQDAVVHPDGSVTVAWSDATTVWAATRPSGETVFPGADPVAVSAVGAPELAVDGAGNVTMVWAQGNLWTASRDAESGGWSTPEPVVEDKDLVDFEIGAALDGTVTFAWAEFLPGPGNHEPIWSATRQPGGVIGAPLPVDEVTGSVDELTLDVNATGRAALSWVRPGSPDGDVQLALRPAADEAFGDPQGISGSAEVRDLKLVWGDDGVVTGGWRENSAPGSRVVGVTRANDGTVTTVPVSASDASVNQLDAVLDQAGTLTLTWNQSDRASGSEQVAAARRPAGGVFEPPIAVSDVTGVPLQRPVLGVAPTGDVTVVYAHGTLQNGSAHVLRSRVLDVNAPTLAATVPAKGTVGSALAMSAAVSDVWGPVSVAWSFGDGSTATGTAASHTYAGAGSFVVRVTATDGSGNVTTLERTVTVAAAPPVPPVGDRTPPVLSRVRLAPDLLPTGHGAKLKVTSTEAGRLVGVVERRKQNGQWREIGAKRWSLQAGRSSKTFYGQAAQLRLDTGKHRVRLVATDAAGNASSPVVLRFRVGPR